MSHNKSQHRYALGKYQYGDKAGRPLARSLHPPSSATCIPSIALPSGEITSEPRSIQKAFSDYFTALYNLPPPYLLTRILVAVVYRNMYMKLLSQNLDVESGNYLDCPFSLEELLEVITNTPSGKSLGPDGITSKFYKIYKDSITSFMLRVFNSISAINGFTPQTLEAHITLLPKPDKDLNLCSSYHQISLIGIDIKSYAKMIALCLQSHIPNLIHADQVGFVQGSEARDNTLKSLLLIDHTHSAKIPACLLSINAEKAFDRVGWPFLEKTFIQIGLGPNLLRKIMALYTKPRARIWINQSLSSSFPIQNGTRQGCPLSPLLFVLVMEHLVTALRQNSCVTGIPLDGQEVKLAVFADDLLLCH